MGHLQRGGEDGGGLIEKQKIGHPHRSRERLQRGGKNRMSIECGGHPQGSREMKP
jgi:hypothetical protein